MVGVGDGPWHKMQEFDDKLRARRLHVSHLPLSIALTTVAPRGTASAGFRSGASITSSSSSWPRRCAGRRPRSARHSSRCRRSWRCPHSTSRRSSSASSVSGAADAPPPARARKPAGRTGTDATRRGATRRSALSQPDARQRAAPSSSRAAAIVLLLLLLRAGERAAAIGVAVPGGGARRAVQRRGAAAQPQRGGHAAGVLLPDHAGADARPRVHQRWAHFRARGHRALAARQCDLPAHRRAPRERGAHPQPFHAQRHRGLRSELTAAAAARRLCRADFSSLHERRRRVLLSSSVRLAHPARAVRGRSRCEALVHGVAELEEAGAPAAGDDAAHAGGKRLVRVLLEVAEGAQVAVEARAHARVEALPAEVRVDAPHGAHRVAVELLEAQLHQVARRQQAAARHVLAVQRLVLVAVPVRRVRHVRRRLEHLRPGASDVEPAWPGRAARRVVRAPHLVRVAVHVDELGPREALAQQRDARRVRGRLEQQRPRRAPARGVRHDELAAE
eukprot:scaffold685_cov324-Prasinococcus_capsulatus_cf.AAC.1